MKQTDFTANAPCTVTVLFLFSLLLISFFFFSGKPLFYLKSSSHEFVVNSFHQVEKDVRDIYT